MIIKKFQLQAFDSIPSLHHIFGCTNKIENESNEVIKQLFIQ